MRERESLIGDQSWVPKLNHQSPHPLEFWREQLIRVQDLIHDDDKSWNVQLINNAFSDRDKLAILAVDTLRPDQPDRWKWTFDKQGKFQVADKMFSLFPNRKEGLNEQWTPPQETLISVDLVVANERRVRRNFEKRGEGNRTPLSTPALG
ncbi:ribonuclease H-like superfamily protein [Striga asiatica]|uniref:Ribonuclease H-like superfamily protein n=1 Tax=Striga asiatica TaxID=4170 RepID=A0A5A7PU28_STRAF|nr:ribonuclease H-like superfamily protein [Striga asiatica]